MQVFTQEWVDAYLEAINANADYQDASRKWEQGMLSMSMILEDASSRTILLDLQKGQCLNAQAVSLNLAKEQASFLIEGSLLVWKSVLQGEIQPLMAIMRGKLKLTQGSISKLMPFAKAAIELVHSAQTIPTDFPSE